jgi:hypothetical protein
MVDEKQRVALKSNFEMAKLHLDMTSTQLKRIFNNSTFKQGGRYYGGWWQRIPRNYRKYILIDDQMTVEIDYSAFHPQLLYMIKKLEPPLGDAYSLPGIPEKARLLIKKTFNILVNATSEESALKAIRKLRRDGDVPKPPKGLTDKLIIDAIRVKHSALDEFFCSGYGTKLQRIDSDIAEQVMLELVQKVIAVLPIHDSFIVRHDHRHALEQAMQNAVIGIFGRGIASKVDVTAWQEIIELGIEEELGGFKGFESTKPSGCDEYYAQMKRWEKMNGRCSTTESPPESIKTLSWGKWRMN